MKKKTLKRGPWDKEELKDLKRFFPHEATASVAAFLNRSFEATKKMASRMGIFKSPKYLKALGRAVVLVLALCLFAGTTKAQDANGLDPAKYSATLFGSNDMIGARFEFLGERTGWGPEFLWQDGLQPDGEEAWGIGLFAHYDLMQNQTLQIWMVNVPTTVYVGVRAGVLYSEDAQMIGENGTSSTDRWDAQAGLVLGSRFGDKQNQLGIEGWVGAESNVWEEFSDWEPAAGAVLTLTRLIP